MKKALIIFFILFILTALIPLSAVALKDRRDEQNDVVTIFSSAVTVDAPYTAFNLNAYRKVGQ